MQHIEWSSEFELGIGVIDAQHKRIVDYINMLVDYDDHATHDEIAELIDSLIDYTYSHFGFEESLMEEASYEYTNVHKRTHVAFTERIDELHKKFDKGEDVSKEIGSLLQTWLINHIKEDDRGYVSAVKQRLQLIENKDAGGWLMRVFRRYFK